jgi:methionyl aminopeptidase
MHLKTPEEIAIMAEGGQRLAEVLRRLADETRPGVTTKQLDRLAYQLIHRAKAKPAFLHYRPTGASHAYPYTLCTSLNDVVVHGQPSGRVIAEGDLVKLDLGLRYKGFYADAALTVGVGKLDRRARKILAATEEALRAAIEAAKPGRTTGDIGAAIEKVVRKNKFAVAQGLTGHGIGRSLHEDPTVFNFGRPGKGEELLPGMVIAIEPMVVAGDGALKQLLDESWGTADGSLAAHFEHTVAITKDGPRILTAL